MASLCIAVALLSPVISHNYFCNILSDSLQENEDLKERIRQYMKPYDPYLMEPYLTAELGWYLHNSSDPVPESRNKLTLYGQMLNIGAVNATKCRLTVSFYVGGNVAQTSEVTLETNNAHFQRLKPLGLRLRIQNHHLTTPFKK